MSRRPEASENEGKTYTTKKNGWKLFKIRSLKR